MSVVGQPIEGESDWDDELLITDDRRESKDENVSDSDADAEADEATECMESEVGRPSCVVVVLIMVAWASWASSPGPCKQRSGNFSWLATAGATAATAGCRSWLSSPAPGNAAMARLQWLGCSRYR